MKTITLISSVTFCGLIAGLFFSWSVAVTKGLALVGDQEYIAAMQAINREIQNPLFFLCFFNAAIALPISAYQQHGVNASVFWLLVTSAGLYIIGVFGVTVAGNVPLNDALDVFDLQSASASQMAKMRASYEPAWNKLNHIRATAAIISFMFAIAACLQSQRL
jgi:uncharacterized membrane protein